MRKFYFILAAILTFASVPAQVITGNFSICLPGPNTTQLSASVPPAPITATTPWFSLNSAVATISSTGLVTGLNFGTTTVSYTDNLGSVYSVNVYVSSFPTITAPNGTSTCESGILQLEGSLFPNVATPWESLDPSIATVDNLGLVTGVSAGVANILYRNLGGCTTTIPITISPSLFPTITCGTTTPTSITFNWNAVLGALTYVRAYTINGGPFISGGNAGSLTYTLSGLSPGDEVIFYVAPSGSVGNCFVAGSTSCSAAPCPNAGNDGVVTICESQEPAVDLFSLITGEEDGGVWTRSSGTGGTFNAGAGIFLPEIGSTTSTFTYTIVGSGPCPTDTSIATININQQANAGSDGFTSICDSSFTPIDLFSLITGEQTGGTWTRVLGTGGIFNAIAGTYTPASEATNSVFEYRIIGVSPCVDDFSIASITINPQPDAGIDGCIAVVDSNPAAIDLYSIITGEDPQGVWTRTSGVGGTFSAAAGTYSPAVGATTSAFTYTTVGVAPCINDTSTATIIINGTSIGQAVSLFCDGANSTANSIAFDWNNVGQTSFNFSYTINGGLAVSGNTTISNYQVLNVPPGSSVTFTVQPIGGNCFPSSTTTCDLLSIDDFESNAVAYFPNPFTDILNLNFDQPIKSVQICNLLGQKVFANNYYEKNIQLNLSYLSSGTYLVKAYAADIEKTFMVVKN